MNGHPSMRPWFRIFRLAIAGLLCCFAGVQLSGQDQPAIQLDRDALLGHLNTVITWYRDITSKVQPTGLPSDAIYQDNAQNLGGQVVRLAFQSARAEADLVPSSAKAAPVKPGTGKGSSKSAPLRKQPQRRAQTRIQIQVPARLAIRTPTALRRMREPYAVKILRRRSRESRHKSMMLSKIG